MHAIRGARSENSTARCLVLASAERARVGQGDVAQFGWVKSRKVPRQQSRLWPQPIGRRGLTSARRWWGNC